MYIAQLFERPVPKAPKFGIELEAEGVRHAHHVDGWARTSDGSLRNHGVEYIFDGPVVYECAVDRVQKLCDYLSSRDPAPIHNARTSVHIHMDMCGLTIPELRSFIVEYTAIEPLLFELFGQGREYSPYCVPLHVGRRYTKQLLRACDSDPMALRETFRNYKYTALSCNRFPDLHTMELRLFNGTNDAQTMLSYLSVCNYLVTGVRAEDIAALLGSPDYSVQAQTIRNLLEFEVAMPYSRYNVTPRPRDSVIAALYRRDGQQVRVPRPNENEERERPRYESPTARALYRSLFGDETPQVQTATTERSPVPEPWDGADTIIEDED